MSYLLSQIWVCLFLTALVAAVAGWLLARSNNKELRESLHSTREDNSRLKNECDYYIAELENQDNSSELIDKASSATDDKVSSEVDMDANADADADVLDDNTNHSDLVEQLNSEKKTNTKLQNKVEEQQQLFTQRIAELEAGLRLADTEKDDSDKPLTALPPKIEVAKKPTSHISLPELIVGQNFLEKDVDLSSTPVVSMETGVNNEDYAMGDLSTPSSKMLKQFNRKGIRTTSELLAKAYDSKSITALAKPLGIEPWDLRSLVSVADLLRIEGVSPINAELLELAGIGRVQDLWRLNTAKLLESITIINRHENKTDKLPSQEEISQWMILAEKLESAVSTNIDRI